MHVHIEVNEKPAQRFLDKMLARGLNQRPTLKWAGEQLEDAFRDNFLAQGALVGGWKPLDPETLMNRPPTPILFGKTGILLYEVTHLEGPPSFVGATSAEFGSNMNLLEWHQNGTFVHGKRHIPARTLIFEPRFFEWRLANHAAHYLAYGNVGPVAIKELGGLFR